MNSGNIIVNSYANNNGEGFDFADPYLFEFLFSFKKGWLLYTPVMIFAFAGVWFMIRESAQGVAFSFVFLLFLYVIASWTCWWYGASYSSRAAIDIYPLLIVLIGYAVVGLWKKRTKWVLISVLSFLTLLNLIQTYQVTKGILNHSFMTREYYLSVFLQFNYPSKEQEKLLGFDIEKMYQEGFSQNKKNYRMIAVYNDQFDKPQKIKSGNEYATELFLPVYKYKKKSHLWLKVSWQYQGEISSLNDVLFYTSTLYNNNNYGWSGYRALGNDVEVDSTNKIISFYYLTPNIRSVYDRFMFGAMNLSENESILIGREIQFFEPIIDY
ncbi:MAG: hypothetical protein JNJ99_07000 [Crocinitomicaceae bacterium]|nr:hypothetical protein [Crocinitomicaceae bacterium]